MLQEVGVLKIEDKDECLRLCVKVLSYSELNTLISAASNDIPFFLRTVVDVVLDDRLVHIS